MKTTIELPDDLVRKIKMKSVLDGRKLKDTIADLLRAGLSSEPGQSRGPRKRGKFPIIKCRRPAERKAELTPERIAEILTQQETSWHAKTRRYNRIHFSPIRYRWLWLRMKMAPAETAMEANVTPSSVLAARRWNVFPGARTVATPSSLKK